MLSFHEDAILYGSSYTYAFSPNESFFGTLDAGGGEDANFNAYAKASTAHKKFFLSPNFHYLSHTC